jgi:hypothetical protein
VVTKLDNLSSLYVVWAFVFQAALIVHFALRKWCFEGYIVKFGWLFYVLSVPAMVISVILLLGGKPWYLWVGGFLFFTWGIFGFVVEYVSKISWRNPIHWPIFGPYVTLYLATSMFYWWPLGRFGRPLWYVYAVLFVVSTILNVTSH